MKQKRNYNTLASLNEFDLDKELDKMIAEQEAANQQEFLDGAAAGDDRNEGNTGEFYFYNATLLSRGFGEFKRYGVTALSKITGVDLISAPLMKKPSVKMKTRMLPKNLK